MNVLRNVLYTIALLGAVFVAGVSNAQVNTVYGQQAANSEQSNAYISIYGYQALYACTYCFGSSAFGANALRVASGSYNTGLGYSSMYNGTSGSYNTAIGTYSLYNLGTGNYNVAIGYYAGGGASVNGSNNVWINNEGLPNDSNVIRIGTQGVQKFTQVAGIFNTKLPKAAGGGQFVMVNKNGQLGVVSTVLHTNSMPTTQAYVDQQIATLRTDLTAKANMIYKLQQEVATLKAAKGVK